MFTALAPQRAKHQSGFIVQTGGRHSLQYLDGDLFAEVEVDFAALTGIYADSLIIQVGNAQRRKPSPEEREIILGRIASALEFWKMAYEICYREQKQ